MAISLDPIGYVRNAVDEATDQGWGGVVSEIVIEERHAPALQGLSDFSHILVIFWMHQAPALAELQRRPRDLADMPLLGLFATRARHRPNPLGVTAVSLEGVDGRRLRVRGLDAINGTPVLDIKPHVPAFDVRAGACTPAWVDRLMQGYF